MTTKALLGIGTEIWMSTDGGATTANTKRLAETTSVSGPTMSSDQIDVTSHDSVGGFREKIPGLSDAGELSFDIFYKPDEASAMLILEAFTDKVVRDFQIVFPPEPGDTTPTGIWDIRGSVTGFEVDIPVDETIKASITIALAGAPDFEATKWTPSP